MDALDIDLLIIESIDSRPWSSLTFAGERHRLVVRLPGGVAATAIDGADLAVAGAIVAVERAVWTSGPAATTLAIDLLAIVAAAGQLELCTSV